MEKIIQINDEWRIRESHGDFFLEVANENGTYQIYACYGADVWAMIAYVRAVLGSQEPYDLASPQDLLALLRKLTDEIETCAKEVGECH